MFIHATQTGLSSTRVGLLGWSATLLLVHLILLTIYVMLYQKDVMIGISSGNSSVINFV